MNTPISWIKAYVPDLDVTAQEFVDAMTLSGSHVEGYEQKDKNLDKIVVGKILTMEKHPDAGQACSMSGRCWTGGASSDRDRSKECKGQ